MKISQLSLFILLLIQGCSSLKYDLEKVKMTYSQEDVKDCLKVQSIRVVGPFMSRIEWLNKVKIAAAQVGADTVVTPFIPVATDVVRGEAYKCGR